LRLSEALQFDGITPLTTNIAHL